MALLMNNRRWLIALIMMVVCGMSGVSLAQDPPPAEEDININTGAAGIHIDANGVLNLVRVTDPTGHLTRQRIIAAKGSLNPLVAATSKSRKISLTRLERAVQELVASGKKPTDDMRYLAGLTRIEYIFYYPESQDIVIAGPAEAYGADLSGRVRGLESGLPTMYLDDLVVALRAFYTDDAVRSPLIGVSIDPTAEGLAKMKSFEQFARRNAGPNDANAIVAGMRESLGMQNIRLRGVPANSHFAQVMVEADYRMKLIGIGLEKPGIRMMSYVDRVSPSVVSRNAMQRWFFVPDYKCVKMSADGMAAQLIGNGVQLISADEMVTDGGQRTKATRINAASKAFADAFTKNYPAISRASPVFGQLRNVIDLSIVAALLRKYELPRKADWKMETFLNEEAYPVETLNVPKLAGTAIAAVWKRNTLVTPIGGGVQIKPTDAMKDENILKDEGGEVAKVHAATDVKAIAKEQWWWD